MTNEELINVLQSIESEMELKYPINNQPVLDEVFKRLRRLDKIETLIKKWDFDVSRANSFIDTIGETVTEGQCNT